MQPQNWDCRPERCAWLSTASGAVIEAEEVLNLVAEAVGAQVLVEPMRQVENPSVDRQRQRRRKIDDDEIGLGWPKLRIVIGLLRAGGRGEKRAEDDRCQKLECRRDASRVSTHNGVAASKVGTTAKSLKQSR